MCIQVRNNVQKRRSTQYLHSGLHAKGVVVIFHWKVHSNVHYFWPYQLTQMDWMLKGYLHLQVINILVNVTKQEWPKHNRYAKKVRNGYFCTYWWDHHLKIPAYNLLYTTHISMHKLTMFCTGTYFIHKITCLLKMVLLQQENWIMKNLFQTHKKCRL